MIDSLTHQASTMTNTLPVQLQKHGQVVRPGLGLTLLPEELTTERIGANRGVIVRDVLPGPHSGAARAGLR
jgi:hypothetical protein